jgi:hypothetical protein
MPSASAQLRELMFGDLPWFEWCKREGPPEEPWPLFRAAWTAKKNNDLDGARACLETIIADVRFMTRHHLQAWHYLRELGGSPSAAEAADVLGIVIENGLPTGLDVLGVYEDHTGRYWNFEGTGVVWDRSEDNLDREIDALFASAYLAVKERKPRKGPRPAPPTPGMLQISFLTPSGVHSGRGPAEVLGGDPLAEAVFEGGAILAQKLMALSKAAAG